MVNNMSPISAFLEQHLLAALEAILQAYEPQLQADFLAEMKLLSEKTSDWINGKIAKSIPTKKDDHATN
jgi:hypothetical protein